jgi:oligoendopeptidase F
MIEKKFIPSDTTAAKWGSIGKQIKKLMKRDIRSTNELLEFLEYYTEIYRLIEDHAFRLAGPFIGYGKTKYLLRIVGWCLRVGLRGYFMRPKAYKNIYTSPYFEQLPEEYSHLKAIITRVVKNKPSIMLMVREYLLVLKYSSKIGKLRVSYQGQQYTLPKIAKFLKNEDRAIREETWRLYMGRLIQEEDALNKLYEKQLAIRTKRAQKQGYTNVRDFFHITKGRTGYTPEDCMVFHNAIETYVIPFVRELNQQRQQKMGLDRLRPWDKAVELEEEGKAPFESIEELVSKMVKTYEKVSPRYGEILGGMHKNGFIDAENRKGKMPGAMCMPLLEHNGGFILANCTISDSDIETLAHEGGHGLHWASMASQPYAPYIEGMLFPMELAELGSMTMELLILDHASEFFPNDSTLKKAKRDMLVGALRSLPWIMTVDAFQQWIYTHPNHTREERAAFFRSIMDRFETATGVDYVGLEREQQVRWLNQGHIFQSPFYYIEYGIAQLGAFAIYRNYTKNPKQAIEEYDRFLHLGNSKPLNEVYTAAGVKFDLSEEYVAEIIGFIIDEIRTLGTF